MKKFFITILIILNVGLIAILGWIFYNNFYKEKQSLVQPTVEIKKELTEEEKLIQKFAGLNYYLEENNESYLSYLKENPDENLNEIIKVVNTKSNLTYFTDSIPTDISKDYLMLTNKYNYLSSDYEPEDLVVLNSSYSRWGSLRSEAAAAFEQMSIDARSVGIYFYNTSPYRSYNTQQTIYNRNVAQDGVSATDRYSARPGYSEHQTGLAVDIVTGSSSLSTFGKTDEFVWVKNNCYKYGFILRYPEDEEYITGYKYEPWHYRYVGVEVATYIYEHDITFEEYYYYFVK